MMISERIEEQPAKVYLEMFNIGKYCEKAIFSFQI